MRFLAYTQGNQTGVAVLSNGEWRGAADAGTTYAGSIQAWIEQGGEALWLAGDRLSREPIVDLANVDLLPPILRPGKIVCVGLNYADHTEESGYKQPDHPTLFPRFTSSLIAAGEPIVRPFVSETLDFEGELVAVIGRRGRHISKHDALDHVAGYSIFNDASIREFQHRTPQWTLGKNFDGTGSFGPWFVTADELPRGAAGLRIETRLNGEVVQASNTDQLIFDVATLVSTISEAITLEPGDLIVTGTPSGIGHARNPRLYMRAGDVVEVEIQSIGTLRNPVVDEPLQRAAS
ncbi:putative 5-oxopent-3-ene-1,2,5-tricarboxylate decarboxylase (plasmid) [Sinorhizobium fredii NGR234]|uniref:5-oxopent-3-ene-1,2,5-tricarboxylate decarboxylase n=1 Tax=Sinorhizobium fredii (strain NBRC 101917 / NGR234) TaxID=394 RepID=Q6W1M6_SINFN|nr:fumarylacetoacetate hydrolase family protein [Sinorhizobium fredii]AAQ87342.1 Fumarylacetoacetate hydrolase family protein [Sinorhizobium fredii NGR234]ACP21880.1 putative 5-oxopent-3-ene-1,2,5-tricarboxylate decarboxylase [Sinorhizobium fredii NGR234]